MNQPLADLPPWWSGEIAIAFTRDEWHSILSGVQFAVNHGAVYSEKRDMAMKIIQKIYKNIGAG